MKTTVEQIETSSRIEARIRKVEETNKSKYTKLMMDCLSDSLVYGYAVAIGDGLFTVTKESEYYQPGYTFGPTYTAEYYSNLYDLSLELWAAKDEVEEKTRKEEVKANAMAKLTPEEKTALGL